MSDFTHLHTASGFSMRYGAAHPEWLAERAAERGMDAVALTDRDSLAGAVRFAKASATAGVRPLFGVDLAVRPSAEQPQGGSVRRRAPVRGGAFIDESVPRAVFLAREGAAGWAALCGLVSAAHAGARERGEQRPALDWSDLASSALGARAPLTVLLGPTSDVGRALAAGRPEQAARCLARWRELFGADLRLEIVYHPSTPAGGGTVPGSLRLAARTLGFAVEQGAPAVLSNATRYADPPFPGGAENSGRGGPVRPTVADVLDAARRLVPLDPRRPEALDGGERWLKGAAAMERIAEQVAEAAGFRRYVAHRLLTETRRTAAACQVDPEYDIGVGSVRFPEPYLVGAGRRTADRALRSRCAAAMVLRGHDRSRRRWRRLEDELRTIERLGFASYFLTVAQVVEDARGLGVRVAARGSGAGSFVNHLLGIAHADPVEHGLLMERFLSVRRAALPDIDIDVESARRLDVYQAIFDRFGNDRVATVAMPETYRVRHAIRDVGAALSMDPAEVDQLAKAFPHIRARDARAALEELPELRSVAAEQHRYGELWDLVEGLDGLPRGIAMHPCGVLLSDASLRARTPVVASADGFAMSQFDKEDVEDLGLLKLDVLGVRMQSAMAHAAGEVERITGRRLDLDDPARVRPGDRRAYELIRSTETLGCFQIESPGQRDLLGRLQPSTFHDLVVDISLFRPGPVAADMVRPFIEARHGRVAPRYPHPDLAEALRDTYGVVVFHEQVIEILRIMTGCGRDLADEARRALSQAARQQAVRSWFAARAAARGYPPRVVAHTWEIVEAFGSYGFCKAHAVAFAVPTYQSAWLKAHHPAAFYAGVLTHDPGMYPKRLLLADARRRGVPILPLDVNRSDAGYRIELVSDGGEGVEVEQGGGERRSGERENDASVTEQLSGHAHVGRAPGGERLGIRLALGDVHGISEAELERVTAGRPYSSLEDLWRRARLGRPVVERLAQVGALDAFGESRRDLLLQIAELHRQQRAVRRVGGGHEDQLPLAEAADDSRPAGLPDLDTEERLGAELGVLGMDASRHLMTDHGEFLDELGAIPAARLKAVRHGETVLVAGAKAATQTPPIRSGRRVIFTTLDDGTGLVDCAFFDDSHEACAHTVFHSWLLLVRGVVQRRGPRSLSVVGATVWNLAELAELRRTGGLEAVAARLAADGAGDGVPGNDGGGTAEPTGAEGQTLAEGRRIRMSTGYALHPWADLLPAGERAATGRKLWHASPGSAG